MSEPKRRRFQIHLSTAIVVMLITAVGIGVYIRYPYYVAERALDAATGDKEFPAWPAVRNALINDAGFRQDIQTKKPPFYIHSFLGAAAIDNGSFGWYVNIQQRDGQWAALQIEWLPVSHYMARQALDEAIGDKGFPAWPVVRKALVNDAEFRNYIQTEKRPLYVVFPEKGSTTIRHDDAINWFVEFQQRGGQWTAFRLGWYPGGK